MNAFAQFLGAAAAAATDPVFLAVAITVGAVAKRWRRFLIYAGAAFVLSHLLIGVVILDYRQSLGIDQSPGAWMLRSLPSRLFAFMVLAGMAASAAWLIRKKALSKMG